MNDHRDMPAGPFVETERGVCFESPIQPEYTLCGDAFDLASHEPGYEQRPTGKRTVTCPHCAHLIETVRRIRTKRDSQ